MSEVEKQFGIQKLYIKDISFETPHSPACFTMAWEPKVEINLGNTTQELQEDLFEVALKVTVIAKIEDKTVYLAEVTQAGLFTARGFSEEEISPMLGSFCPNILFPYLREAVSDLVTRGGFPPMILAPVNFDALYMQHQQQQAQTGDTVH